MNGWLTGGRSRKERSQANRNKSRRHEEWPAGHENSRKMQEFSALAEEKLPEGVVSRSLCDWLFICSFIFSTFSAHLLEVVLPSGQPNQKKK